MQAAPEKKTVRTTVASKTTTAQAKAKAASKKKLPVCSAKDLKKKKSRRRKCTVPKKVATKAVSATKSTTSTAPGAVAPAVAATPGVPTASPTGPVAAPPVTSPSPSAWTPLPSHLDSRRDGLITYQGDFGPEQATRLLFRAGFGPTPGQAAEFASLGLTAAVDRLVNPGPAQLVGPAPTGSFLVDGQFAPADLKGHGHLQWLDRMVRSTDQLTERMTYVLHDWLAISALSVPYVDMVPYIELLRRSWRGSFRQLMLDITHEPAMLQWLSGLNSEKSAPNENYARELMELFCLGADRGAYTETDVREVARAMTGWTAKGGDGRPWHDYYFEPKRWDASQKVLFAGTPYERRGNWNWSDAVNAVIDHPAHATFVAMKLWGAFVPTPPTEATLASLASLYRDSGEQLAPLVQAILLHPDLYNGPSMTKSPVTYVGGLMRARGLGITDTMWMVVCDNAGQMLWYPPNVSGWNERAWLNTTTYQGRWGGVIACVRGDTIDEMSYEGSTETPEQAVDRALAFWGNTGVPATHRAALVQHARDAMNTISWADRVKRTQRQYSLRILVVASPDHQVS